jgi:hypothetical protein
LLQLQKTYKGDDRFKLAEDAGFDIDLKDKDAKKVLPQSMLGALSKREEGLLKDKDEEAPKKVCYQCLFTLILEEEV